MAKTNPYNSRQAAALALEEAQAAERGRHRSAASERGAAAKSGRRAQLRFDEYDESEDYGEVGELASPDRSDNQRSWVDASRNSPDAPRNRVDAQRERLLVPRMRRRVPVDQQRFERGRVAGRAGGSRFWGFLLRTRFGLVLFGLSLLALAAAVLLGYRELRSFLEHDSHFRIASSSSIQIVGAAELSPGELVSVFGGDLGRNIFLVPLARRQAQLEQVPWVAHATVMRLLPDQLRISVVERVPVAFVRLGSTVALVDGDGVILHLPPATLAARHYSFPVVMGLNPQDPPESRAARMHLYQRFVGELDTPGQDQAHTISSQLSEVDLTDPEDVRAIVPAEGSDILLHFGDSDFLARYRSYQAHVAEWRQQYPHLSAIDLRYDRQVVLKMADGSENEASSVEHGNSLTAAPAPVAHHAPANHTPTHHSPAAHYPAGHGSAYGWTPQ